MIVVVAIAAILAAPAAMAGSYEDCVALYRAEIKGSKKSIFDKDVQQAIDKCVEAKAKQRRSAETDTRYVSVENTQTYRQQEWYGLRPSQSGLMNNFDKVLGSARGVVDLVGEWKRVQNPERYYGGYGGSYYSGGGYGYNSYSALVPVLLRNTQVCDIAYRQGHVKTPYC